MADAGEGAVILDAEVAADRSGQPQPNSRRRRQLFRLSVRGLLLLVLVIGCGMGWVAHVINTGNVQRRAVSAIYQAGGWALYDTEWDQANNTATWKPRWPGWFVEKVGIDYLGNVVFVNLHDRGTDDVLDDVGRLTHLKQLHRPGAAVTDAGLAKLGQLGELELLSLEKSQVTDAGLSRLKKLKALKWLNLSRTSVSDGAVHELQRTLPRLQAIRSESR